jgi:hypothetical protein
VNDHEYGGLHLLKKTAYKTAFDAVKDLHDARTIAATGRPAVTTINKSLVRQPGNAFEKEHFPSLSQMECTPENLHKVFYFAALSAEQNRLNLAAILTENSKNQLAQGEIDKDEYEYRMPRIEKMSARDAWPTLENIIVTDKNGPEIYKRLSVKPKKQAVYHLPLSTAVQAARFIARQVARVA